MGKKSEKMSGDAGVQAEQRLFGFALVDARSWLEAFKKEEKRGRGRPSKINLAVVERIADSIAMGMTEEMACLEAGVSLAAWQKACQRNPDFVLLKKRGKAVFTRNSLEVIACGATGWQGRAWILERTQREQFSKSAEVTVETGDKSVTFVVSADVQQELAQAAAELFLPGKD